MLTSSNSKIGLPRATDGKCEPLRRALNAQSAHGFGSGEHADGHGDSSADRRRRQRARVSR
jgi:hypothetical protein